VPRPTTPLVGAFCFRPNCQTKNQIRAPSVYIRRTQVYLGDHERNRKPRRSQLKRRPTFSCKISPGAAPAKTVAAAPRPFRPPPQSTGERGSTVAGVPSSLGAPPAAATAPPPAFVCEEMRRRVPALPPSPLPSALPTPQPPWCKEAAYRLGSQRGEEKWAGRLALVRFALRRISTHTPRLF
jgi:hypothetical protein